MRVAFADTYYFLALLNPHDAAHDEALVVADSYSGSLVTTQWVLIEVVDALSDPRDRSFVVQYVRSVMEDSRFRIISATDQTFQRGFEFFDRRKDKSWSLTDCISFVVMSELGITDALTGDQHFRQAGFKTLL